MFAISDFCESINREFKGFLSKINTISDTDFTKSKNPDDIKKALLLIIECEDGFSLTTEGQTKTYYEDYKHCLKRGGVDVLRLALEGKVVFEKCPFLKNIDDGRCVLLTQEEIGLLEQIEDWLSDYR